MRKPCLFLSTLMISILRQDSGSVRFSRRFSSSSMARVSGISFSTADAASVMLSAETCAVPMSTISRPANAKCFCVSVFCTSSVFCVSVASISRHLADAPFCKSILKEHRAVHLHHLRVVRRRRFNATKHIIKKPKIEVHLAFFVRIVNFRNALYERKFICFIMECTQHKVFNGIAVHGAQDRIAEFLSIDFVAFLIVAVGDHERIGNIVFVNFTALCECFARFGPVLVMECKHTNAFIGKIILRVQLYNGAVVCKRFRKFFLFIIQSGAVYIAQKIVWLKLNCLCPRLLCIIEFSKETEIHTVIKVVVVVSTVERYCFFYIICGCLIFIMCIGKLS